MKWQKSPQELIDLFVRVMPGLPAVQRQMFGYPAGFINGNMFMGLFQNDMILRLPETEREEFLKIDGARIFEPMAGRPMREYVAVPARLMKDHKRLGLWVSRSRDYGASLEPKPSAKKSKTAAERKRSSRRK